MPSGKGQILSVLVLGIETSCDETAAAVVADGRTVLSNVVASQEEIHRRFGGVVPEVASRQHLEALNLAIASALAEAGVGFADLRAVAVTHGPGLLGSLLVGLMAAKSLCLALEIPLITVNHIEAHIYAGLLVEPDVPFPFVALVVSGGHTDIVYAAGHSELRLIGQTRDDAAGEAFDKVARVLGLGYPGGPAIERLAREGNPEAVPLPRAFLEEDTFDTSFSGLKTAVVNYLYRARREGRVNLADVAASFQAAVAEVLVAKAVAAADAHGARALVLAGGVAANGYLRESLLKRARKHGLRVVIPPPVLCTDNAAMVAAAGYYRFLRGDFAPLTANAVAGLSLEESFLKQSFKE
ncbi:MAG: tRNA (adenosine(37)-N6)-threonylcarbamoyltransferase complex transferase subunit TsaD [Thermoanaerobacteraceae bacterium]|nr:tRNA (adenosine(37)-N6)-threonylcarbamoyltransferase complex transferase subunit TsaD [Thermoanaerobacteraceae bacterium]